ncbi:hypothetical protein SEA_PHAYETA_95 [Mycobacterium phage Phayeta]|nr:hypothetical protein SEA_PHAYETA_95 [Mycobacterium phage Phayeta]
MDIEKALADARAAAENVLREWDQLIQPETTIDASSAAELAEAFQAIDQWLSRTGALPADWRRETAEAPSWSSDQNRIPQGPQGEPERCRCEHGPTRWGRGDVTADTCATCGGLVTPERRPCPGVGRELQMSRVGEGMCRYCNAVLATSNGLAPPHARAWTGVDERRG